MGDPSARHYANVVVPPLNQPFTYAVPAELQATLGVGYRVSVPFGRRHVTGFVVSGPSPVAPQDQSFEIKAIESNIVPFPCFAPGQLEFFQWVADYYGDSLASVIDVAVPKEVPTRFTRTVTLSAAVAAQPRGLVQRQILAAIGEAGGSIDMAILTTRFKSAAKSLEGMVAQGIVTIAQEEKFDSHRLTTDAPDWAKRSVDLTSAQTTAVAAIAAATRDHRFETSLLHGVTGSGKTEVYIEAIKVALSAGYGGLVIVPEIALTPQLLDRFQARLGNDLAVLHSGLSPRLRWDSWRALLAGRARIAIGARSAIFAPVPNLGLIIVDEEHDPSYKQNEGLRYNARDLALVRGRKEQVPVVLGSATPSLETFYHAYEKKFRYLPLAARPDAASRVSVTLIDLNTIRPRDLPRPNISAELKVALEETIRRGEQAFVLYNRRGFASYLQCDTCEKVLECPNCSVTLTFHQHKNALVCHYCNLTIIAPTLCPTCSATTPGKTPGTMQRRGAGTEKVFDELRELFPATTIERLDRDAASDLETYRGILDRVRSGATSILVGTQMIAKGHDLPNVTLVGIADCDVGLHIPDFRAGERVFHLLTQAAGRAGRGSKAGRVILQTRVPQHPSLDRTLAQDYVGFARSELRARKELGYPPFNRLLRIVAGAPDPSLSENLLLEIRSGATKFIADNSLPIRILGPAPAPIERIKTLWRHHILFKAQSPAQLNQLMRHLRARLKESNKIRVTFDMDPYELL